MIRVIHEITEDYAAENTAETANGAASYGCCDAAAAAEEDVAVGGTRKDWPETRKELLRTE